jgi:competence protein ComEC
MRSLTLAVAFAALAAAGCAVPGGGADDSGKLFLRRPSFTLPIQNMEDGKLWVWFIETGLGQAALVKSPDNRWVLIDTGPRSELRGVAELLIRLHVTDLDALFLTNPDPDHASGAAALAARLNLHIKTVYHNGQILKLGTSDYRTLMAASKAQASPTAGDDPMRIGDLTFQALNPPPAPFLDSDDDEANNSLVLRMECGKRSFIFASDAHVAAERKILANEKLKPLLAADVLQAGSHGREASTSAEFAKAVSPRLVIVQGAGGNPSASGRRPGDKDANAARRADGGRVHLLVRDAIQAANPDAVIKCTHETGTIAVIADGETLVYRAAQDAGTKQEQNPVK